ncbi:MAG: hypothetical protein M3Y08_19590 [Fibrobacterota bacterium]|nr:hypothetical protein [Fibrobacterota bacterium]
MLAVHPLQAQQAQVSATVNVDFSKPITGVKNLTGFLHGIDSKTPSDERILPLRPRSWRIGSLSEFDRLRSLGVTHFEHTLSDDYGYGGSNGWPYDDWPRWEAYIRTKAVHLKSSGIMEGVEFKLDPFNEPNIKMFWKGTFPQYLETYKRAYLILREVLGPTAMIGGPNESRFLREDIKAFMEFCLANKLEANYISWHHQREVSLDIGSILSDIQWLRENYVDNPAFAPLKIKEWILNEYAAWSVQYQPADILAHLHYMEKGKVSAANKACWNSSYQVAPDLDKTPGKRDHCLDHTLDGILEHGTQERLSAWFAYEAYGKGDAAKRVESAVTSADAIHQTGKRVFAIPSAARVDSSNQAFVIIGNYNIVKGSINWGDMTLNDNSPPTAQVTLKIAGLAALPFMAGAAQTRVSIHRLVNSENKVSPGFNLVREQDVPVVAGSITLDVGNLGLHEILGISIRNPALPSNPIGTAISNREGEFPRAGRQVLPANAMRIRVYALSGKLVSELPGGKTGLAGLEGFLKNQHDVNIVRFDMPDGKTRILREARK